MDGSINFSGTLAGTIADSGGGKIQDVQTNASGDYESVVDEQGIAKIDLSNYATDEQLESAVNSINNVLLTKQNIVDYSTEEQNTGIKWIDGKDIYCRVLDLGSDTSFSTGWHTLSIPHNNVVNTMVKASGIYSGGYSESIGFAANDPTYFEVECYRTTSIRYIIYYYTKN